MSKGVAAGIFVDSGGKNCLFYRKLNKGFINVKAPFFTGFFLFYCQIFQIIINFLTFTITVNFSILALETPAEGKAALHYDLMSLIKELEKKSGGTTLAVIVSH